MVSLNGVEYAWRPGMSLKELVADYNADYNKLLALDGFVVLVNEIAITTLQAQEKILSDNDKILIIPMLAGG